jgi:hypothetical protein
MDAYRKGARKTGTKGLLASMAGTAADTGLLDKRMWPEGATVREKSFGHFMVNFFPFGQLMFDCGRSRFCPHQGVRTGYGLFCGREVGNGTSDSWWPFSLAQVHALALPPRRAALGGWLIQ